MLVWGLLLSIAAGWLLGGRLSRFQRAGLGWIALPTAAFLVQALGLLAGGALLPAAVLASYGLILLFLWRNRHLKKTFLCWGAGCLCNLAVIAANGFSMPVSQQALPLLSPERAAALMGGAIPMYHLAGADTRLPFLGDMLYLPPLRGFVSVGDLLLAAGVFFCLMAAMSPARGPRFLTTG